MPKATSHDVRRPEAIGFAGKSFFAAYHRDRHVSVVDAAGKEFCRVRPEGQHLYECAFARNDVLIIHSGNEAVSTRLEAWSLPGGTHVLDIPLVDGEIAIDEANGRLAYLEPMSTHVAIHGTARGDLIARVPAPPELELPVIAISAKYVGFADHLGRVIISDLDGQISLTLSHKMSDRDPEEFAIKGPTFAALTLAGTHGVAFVQDAPPFQWCPLPHKGNPISQLILIPDGNRAVAATRECVVLLDPATCTAEQLSGTAPIALNTDGRLLASFDRKQLFGVSDVASGRKGA